MKKYLVIYPFLFAAFPVLFLYTYNIVETPIAYIIIPMGASLILSLLLWLFLTWILKDMHKAGLATTIFLFFFFSYGRFYELLESWDVFVLGHGYLLPTVLLVFGYSVYFIKLARKDFKTTTMVLNVIALVLIIINVVTAGSYHFRAILSAPSSTAEPGHEVTAIVDPDKQKTMPDIYLIIPDAYAHSDSIRECYNYDNSQFVNNLIENGFFIADGSRTRVALTEWSIASTLNMEYTNINDTKETMHQKLANNKVVEFLKSKGYKFVYFGSINWFKNADLYLYSDYKGPPRYVSLTTDFMRLMCNTTMLRPFYDSLSKNQFETRYRRLVIDTIDRLKNAPEIKGPKFVFTYLYCPHEPFVFGAHGENINAINWTNYKDKQFYLGQYIYITGEIETIIDVLLEKSAIPPIIIIQSDHGIRPAPDRNIPNDEWKKIFNAYYLPDGAKELLYDSISPVNSFRLIFNYYFDTDYDLLED